MLLSKTSYFCLVLLLLTVACSKKETLVVKQANVIGLKDEVQEFECVIAYPKEFKVWAVQLDLPKGLLVSNISNNGKWSADYHTLKWGPWFDGQKRDIRVSLKASEGNYEVKGVASFDGKEAELKLQKR